MAAAAHGKGKRGIPQSVAREMIAKTPPATRRRLARAQAKRHKLKKATRRP
jgi:phage terminase Nu1 subunit (DNA packaging protein)